MAYGQRHTKGKFRKLYEIANDMGPFVISNTQIFGTVFEEYCMVCGIPEMSPYTVDIMPVLTINAKLLGYIVRIPLGIISETSVRISR